MHGAEDDEEEDEDDEAATTTTFTRTASTSSTYSIDGKSVPLSQYAAELEKIRLFIKAKNFLVYQGQVDKIAMTNPKERMTLFEELSK